MYFDVIFGEGERNRIQIHSVRTRLKGRKRHGLGEFNFVFIRLVCPCKNQDLKWNEVDKRVYRDILYSADKVVVLADTYYDGCMQARNRHLVDNSKYCICYLEHMRGGTYNTVKYAQKNSKKTIYIKHGEKQ